MLPSSLHIGLALAMVALGGAAAWIMLEAFGGRTPKERSRSRAALHRALGRTFVAAYLVLLVSMTDMALEQSALGPMQAIHATLGTLVLPILLVKVLIVRRWEPLHRFLPLLGVAVFTLTFVTVGLGLLSTHASGEGTQGDASLDALPDHPGRQPFLRYCGQCHALSRPLGLASRTAPSSEEWTARVGTMRDRAVSRGRAIWSEAEGAEIVAFLVAVGQGSTAAGGAGAGNGSDDGEDDRGRGRGRGGR